ncbi:protein phosphatase 2C domain-containing protein, partial [Neobacillus jeddahensis]
MRDIFQTDQGRVRQNNEDSGGIFINRDGHRLAIVADGMGGHRAGDVASNMTVSHLQRKWEETEGIHTADQAEAWLKASIVDVNKLLFNHAQNNPECEGMGTTLEAVIATENFTTIAHVGDSRCYILNEAGFQ